MNLGTIIIVSWLSTLTAPLVEEIADARNSRLQLKKVNFDGENIAYQHQFWKIKKGSVCSNHSGMTPAYSACTVKAKRLFHELCDYLTSKSTGKKYQAQYKVMYCSAAASYKPTIISISKSNPEAITDYEKARLECNALTAEAIGSHDDSLIRRRDSACAKIHRE